MRIVSLLPAATDLVAVLGRLDNLVGRTHECDWPPSAVDTVPIITSTNLDSDHMTSREISDAVGGSRHRGSSLYTVDTQALAATAPDIILTQDLCDVCAVSYQSVTDAVRVLDTSPQVVSLEPATLPQVLDCLLTLGKVLSATDTAAPDHTRLLNRLTKVAQQVAGRPKPRVAAIEWLDPIWPAGHWVPDQIHHAGGIPLLGNPGEHTAPIPWETLVTAQPDVLILMPCGYNPQRTVTEINLLTHQRGWSHLPAVQTGKVWVVNGPAHFNRPGPRLIRGIEIVAHLLHGVPIDPPITHDEARRIAD